MGKFSYGAHDPRKIKLHTPDGYKVVLSAWVCGDWAVTPWQFTPGVPVPSRPKVYAVTYRPTGACVPIGPTTLSQAKLLAHELDQLGEAAFRGDKLSAAQLAYAEGRASAAYDAYLANERSRKRKTKRAELHDIDA